MIIIMGTGTPMILITIIIIYLSSQNHDECIEDELALEGLIRISNVGRSQTNKKLREFNFH